MAVAISIESANSPDAMALLQQRDTELDALYAPEENFRIPIERHVDPKVIFIVAREGDTALGCGALQLEEGYAELKSIFVARNARRRSIGRRLIEGLERIAREQGVIELRLETGIHSHAALNLYEKAGYRLCGRFGDYPANQTSVYMAKSLAL